MCDSIIFSDIKQVSQFALSRLYDIPNYVLSKILQ